MSACLLQREEQRFRIASSCELDEIAAAWPEPIAGAKRFLRCACGPLHGDPTELDSAN
jgi:hypothetical protein